MIIDGYWVPNQFPKQLQIFNSKARALLVHGPRISGKSRACLHKIVRHLWENDGARVGFFARTLKSTKDGGTWNLLTKADKGILSEWMHARIGLRYTSRIGKEYGVKTDGVTRTPYFRISNSAGGESECLLFSLDNDDEVEAKLKELEFSLIYFSECDKFGDRRILTVALPSLRLAHIPYENQQWIGDCNPAEEGDQSWLHQVFFKERFMEYGEYVDYQRAQELIPLPEQDFREFYSRMDAIQVLPSENPWVDPRQLQDIRVSCGSDQGLYARHVLGEWVWGGGDSSRHFRALWGNGSRHITPGTHCNGLEEEWVIGVPSANCFELVTGWDLGETHHAAVILERYYVDNKICFAVLDEQVTVGEVSNEEFTEMFLEIITDLEKDNGRQYDLARSWSDRSSIEKYSASADTYPYLQVHAASEGRILLQGVHKAPGSVRVRVNLLKQFLKLGRIKISAHCTNVIQMLKDLKKGKDRTNFVVDTDPNKHIFDALTYAMLAECAEELEAGGPSVRKADRSPLEVHVR